MYAGLSPAPSNTTKPRPKHHRRFVGLIRASFNDPDYYRDGGQVKAYTPEFTNMTDWKIPMFNRKYIFIHGGCFIVMLGFLEGNF